MRELRQPLSRNFAPLGGVGGGAFEFFMLLKGHQLLAASCEAKELARRPIALSTVEMQTGKEHEKCERLCVVRIERERRGGTGLKWRERVA